MSDNTNPVDERAYAPHLYQPAGKPRPDPPSRPRTRRKSSVLGPRTNLYRSLAAFDNIKDDARYLLWLLDSDALGAGDEIAATKRRLRRRIAAHDSWCKKP